MFFIFLINPFLQDIIDSLKEHPMAWAMGAILIPLLIFFFRKTEPDDDYDEDRENRRWLSMTGRIDISDTPGEDEFGNSYELRQEFRWRGKIKIFLFVIYILLLIFTFF
ncbi:MAG: hypothetical protein K1X86_05385 [Ignavibacteria bacterium]|nr:hypothetical protein [Ignavibacteria bacterium]